MYRGQKIVLHDRPPAHFHRASPSEIHELFQRLEPSLDTNALRNFLPSSTAPYSTPFTKTLSKPPKYPTTLELDGEFDSSPMPSQREDRPALLISSTSWTPDEDFSILLEALSLYEEKARARNDIKNKDGGEGTLPKVLMVVTGKGPDREKYMNEVGRLQEDWRWVRCVSMWLEPQDYPLILGNVLHLFPSRRMSAHSSMYRRKCGFGHLASFQLIGTRLADESGGHVRLWLARVCIGLCMVRFFITVIFSLMSHNVIYSLDELVHDGVNGLVFHNAQELATQIAVRSHSCLSRIVSR